MEVAISHMPYSSVAQVATALTTHRSAANGGALGGIAARAKNFCVPRQPLCRYRKRPSGVLRPFILPAFD
jgi:hypothetical protein